MKIVLFSAKLLIVILLFSTYLIAAIPIDGWYSSVFGGYTNMPNNINISHNNLLRTHASYDNGYHAGGRIGYKSNPLRYEGEITYINANLSHFYINTGNNFVKQTGVNGDTNGTFTMANIYYDFPDMVPTIAPFLGIGLGYSWINSTLNSLGPNRTTHYNASNNVFAYQGTAGLTYNFAENYSLNLAYRYVATNHVQNLGRIFQANLGTVGVIYRFNENNYQ